MYTGLFRLRIKLHAFLKMAAVCLLLIKYNQRNNYARTLIDFLFDFYLKSTFLLLFLFWNLFNKELILEKCE